MKTFVFDEYKLKFFPVYPCTADVKYPQELIVRKNGMKFNQIFVVSDGIGSLNVGDEFFDMKKGDMFFLPSGCPHTYRGKNRKFKTTYMGFSGGGCESLFDYYNVHAGCVYSGVNSAGVEAAISDLYECFEYESEISVLSSKAYNAVNLFFYEALKENKMSIERVYEFLELNYQKPVAINDILEIYPYSKSKLYRDFKEKYGVSIFDVLTDIRLRHAHMLLVCDPCMKIKAVAENCGFNDASYFCRIYKRKYKKSPGGERTL